MANLQYETYDILRIANGWVSASTILGSSDYLITNFPIQSDSKFPNWLVYMDGGITNGTIQQSLSGAGGLQGKYSGTLTLALFTPDMQQYWFDTVMGGKYISKVTLYAFHQRQKEVTINCYLRWFENITDNGTQSTDTDFTNVTMTWNRGVFVGNAYSPAYSEGYS